MASVGGLKVDRYLSGYVFKIKYYAKQDLWCNNFSILKNPSHLKSNLKISNFARCGNAAQAGSNHGANSAGTGVLVMMKGGL
jgi:hypothetical protein